MRSHIKKETKHLIRAIKEAEGSPLEALETKVLEEGLKKITKAKE